MTKPRRGDTCRVCRPFGALGLNRNDYPGLAPWAKLCRPFGAKTLTPTLDSLRRVRQRRNDAQERYHLTKSLAVTVQEIGQGELVFEGPVALLLQVARQLG